MNFFDVEVTFSEFMFTLLYYLFCGCKEGKVMQEERHVVHMYCKSSEYSSAIGSEIKIFLYIIVSLFCRKIYHENGEVKTCNL